VSLIISNPKNFIINESLMSKLMSAFETISLQEGLSNSSINMRIVDDKEMTALNKKFRNKDTSTNVLSFTNDDISSTFTGDLGDIAINYDFIKKESKKQNKNFDDHMIHMLVHGIYHILGFDHKNDEMAEFMEEKEIAILNELKIRNPYK
tara:strand:+ start:5742 stop:6191 length:450 start_codon:yes stop_codon:yes gene_type:complete